jgi:hypothetical protein
METASADNPAVLVERAVMAPDVPKVDPVRYPDIKATIPKRDGRQGSGHAS